MASIVFVLLVIVFWEVGRSVIKKIGCKLNRVFRKPPSARTYYQSHEQQVLQTKTKFLQDIKQETSTMLGQGQVASLLIKDRILKEARDEAKKILQEAKGEIEQIRREAVQAVQKDMVEMVCFLNQHRQNNASEYVLCSSKASQRAIEKYLDNYHMLKGRTYRTNRLL